MYNERRLAALNAFINDPSSIEKPNQLLLELTGAIEEIDRLQADSALLTEMMDKILGLREVIEIQGKLLKRWADISSSLENQPFDEFVNVSPELQQLIEETKQCQQ